MKQSNQPSQPPFLTPWVKQLDDALLAHSRDTAFKAGALETGQRTFEICIFTLGGQDYLYAKFHVRDDGQIQLYHFEGHLGLKEVLPPILRHEGIFSFEQILAAFEAAEAQEEREKTIKVMLVELLESMVMLNVEPSDIAVYLLIGILWTFVETGSFFIPQSQHRIDEPGPWLVYFLVWAAIFLAGRILGRLWQRHNAEPTSNEISADEKSV